MKAKRITYSKLVSRGNYEHSKIEIELEVEEGEKAAAVFNAAKKWVDERCLIEKTPPYAIDRAEEILKDRRNHTIAEVENAESILESQVIKEDGLPF